MKFKLKINTAHELATLCNSVGLISKAFGMKLNRITTHRYHAEKVRLLRHFESLTEEERAEVLCAAIVMRESLAALWHAKVEVEVTHDQGIGDSEQ